jgi:redox-sensitive bicupin YhaK (pirin superfamily)
MTKSRSIASVGGVVKRPRSDELSAAHLSAASIGHEIDPVIGIDHFNVRAPVFAPHPHAGFSAVTYLFEDSEGEFVNRDSLGHQIVAKPGAVIWTITGSGVLHEEYPRQRGRRSHGLQVSFNLAAAEKMQAPRVMFVDGPEVPAFEGEGLRARVVAGAVGGVSGKLEPPGEVLFLDVKLGPDAAFEHPVPADFNALAYVVAGSVFVGDRGRLLRTLDAATFATDGDAVLLRATAGEVAHVVLIAGRPLHERVVSNGPFIMNSEQQLASAIERYHKGHMGRLWHANIT